MKYRKRPVVIEAYQWNGEYDDTVYPNESDVGHCSHCGRALIHHGRVTTLEGHHIACPGDWIITGVAGEQYPCKPDIFKATYEEAHCSEQ